MGDDDFLLVIVEADHGSLQRTRMVDSERAIDTGVFATVDVGPLEISMYGFNLDGDAPFAMLGLALVF